MTFEIVLVFLVIAGALYLFASEKLPLDISAMLILFVVMGIPIVFHSGWLVDRGIDLQSAFPTITEGLSGFSSTATVTVLAMFILSAGIQRTGMIHMLGKRLFPMMRSSETRQILVIGLAVGPISGFINNTAAVAIAIPLVLDVARRTGSPAARLLMPVSFFGMLGGTLTLVGTSTNILASSLISDDPRFAREIGMFEFSRLGAIVLVAGLIYLLTFGRRLMPKKDAMPLAQEPDERFLVELKVPSDSGLIGHALKENGYWRKQDLTLEKLIRDDKAHVKQAEETELASGDILLVRATTRGIMDIMNADELDVLSEFGDPQRVRGDGQLVRVLLRNRIIYRGSTAAEIDFWERYQTRLIGLDKSSTRNTRLANEALHVGDIVLVEASNTAMKRLRNHPDVVILDESVDDFERGRMWTALGIVAAVVGLAVLTPLPIVLTAIGGVIAMTATGCLHREDLYSGVSWDVILLLAGVIPLGIAMSKSGGADWLGGVLADVAVHLHPILILMGIYLVTTLLTEIVSNNAAAVVLVPVALSMADELALEPLPLVLAVMFAASTSFLTPVGYQTNTMIYGTGVYRFTDFMKVGAPLNIFLMVTTSVGLWWLWPLEVT